MNMSTKFGKVENFGMENGNNGQQFDGSCSLINTLVVSLLGYVLNEISSSRVGSTFTLFMFNVLAPPHT